MGKNQKWPVDNDVVKDSAMGNRQPDEQILDRLGLNGQVCQSCNARAPADADSCRKCGDRNLRQKNRDVLKYDS